VTGFLKRWLKRLAWTLAVLLILGRLCLPWFLPWLANAYAEDFGYRLSFERMELSLTGADVELAHIELVPSLGQGPRVHVEYARVDLAVLSLAFGEIVLRRVELDGLDANLERDRRGELVLPDWDFGEASDDADQPPQDEHTQPGWVLPFVLPPNLQLDAVRAQQVQFTYTDNFLDPPLTTRLDLDLRLSDLGAADRPTRLSLLLASTGLLDRLSLEVTGRLSETRLDAELAIRMAGLDLRPIAGLLAQLGLEPLGPALELGLSGELRLLSGATPELDLTLSELRVAAGAQELLSLQSLVAEADLVSPVELLLPRVELVGLHAGATLEADGAVRLPGLRLRSPPEGAEEPQPTSDAASALTMRLGTLALHEHRLSLVDESSVPATVLTLEQLELQLSKLELGPDASSRPAQLALELSAPGVCERLRVEAQAVAAAGGGPFELHLLASGLRPDALTTPLAAVGVVHRLRDAELSLGLDGAWSPAADGGLGADVRLSELVLSEGGTPLMALGELSLAGLALSADGGVIAADSLRVAGLRLRAEQLADGGLRLPGLDLVPPSAPVAAPAPAATSGRRALPPLGSLRAAQAPLAPPPRPHLSVQRAVFEDNRLSWAGLGKPPLRLSECALELNRFVWPPTGLPSVDALTLGLSVPGLVEQLTLTGAVQPASEGAVTGVQLELGLSASGLDSSGLVHTDMPGPRLDLSDGSLSWKLSASARGELHALQADARLSELTLVNAGQEQLGLDELLIEGLSLVDGQPALEALELSGLRLAVRRDEQGRRYLPGLLLPPVAAADSEPAQAEPAQQPAAAVAPALVLPALRCDRIALNDASLHLVDELRDEPMDARLVLDVELSGLLLGPEPGPLSVDLTLQRVETGMAVSVSGRLLPSPSTPRAELDLSGRGLEFELLAPYLTPFAEPALQAGSMDGHLTLALDPGEQGGTALAAWLSDVSLSQGQQSLLSWDRLGLSASRIDPQAGVYVIDELALEGVVTRVERHADGSLEVSGLRLLPRAPGERLLPALMRSGEDHRQLVDVQLTRLSLGVERVDLIDAGRAALALTDLTLTNDGPLILDDDELDAPAFGLELSASLPPLLDRLSLYADLAPFAVEPRGALKLELAGLRGPELAALAPELDGVLDASELLDGRLEFELTGTYLGRRRGPLHFDTSGGVPLELSLSELAFRDGEDGEVLLGLDSMHAQVSRALGSDGALKLSSLELLRPVLHGQKTARGVELAHLVLPPAPTPEADAQPARPGHEQPTIQGDYGPGHGQPSFQGDYGPGPERSIKRLVVAGIDVTWADRTTTPPLVIPLVGLDLELRGLSSRLLTEKRELSVDLLLQGGVVDEPWARPRPVFEELELEAVMSLYPGPVGRVHMQSSALDLTALAGPAAESKVTINDGIMDSRVDLHFRDDGELDVDSRTMFTDLDVEEPPDGPISRFLKLPSPLGTVLFVLRDEDGVITVPLAFELKADGMSTAEASRVAVATLGRLIARAIANTPFRLVGGITGTVGSVIGFGFDFGFGGGEVMGEAERIPFYAVSATLPVDVNERIAALVEFMEDEDELRLTLHHEPGVGDVELLKKRANPSPLLAGELAGRMRVRKARLQMERAAAAEKLRAVVASGLYERAASYTLQLAALDEEIGRLEQALDALLEVLRPGSAGVAERRTRMMTVEVARLRLDAVVNALKALLDEDEFKRVRVLPPRPSAQAVEGPGVVVVEPSRAKRN